MPYQQFILVIYAIYIVVMSILSFVLFKRDKRLASKAAVRIKEKTLLESVVLGGAIGGFIGRILCHHKTNKIYFSVTIYLSLILQLGLAIMLIVLAI